jgi:ABC-type transport system involved in multi-copper enzyme maturation permease subunit
MLYVSLAGLTIYLFLGRLSGARSPSESAALGRHLFNGLVTFQMGYVSIVIAHLTADLLLREARSGTLQLMLMTPLSGWRIGFGKWKVGLAHAATLILAGLPSLAMAAYLGGVGPWDLLWSASLSLGLAGFASSLSLYNALTSRSPVRATVAAMATITIAGLGLAVVICIGSAVVGPSWVVFIGCMLHPMVAAIGAANPAIFGELSSYGWIGATVFSLALSQVFIMSTAGHLSISSTLDELLAPRGLAASEVTPGIPSLTNRTVWDRNPLLWKEISGNDFSRLGWTRRTTLVAFLPVLLVASNVLSEGSANLGVWLMILTGLAMSAGAVLFVRDKEGRHLEVLLTLPVTSAQIVGAKLLSGAWTVEGAAFFLWTVIVVGFWQSWRMETLIPLETLIVLFILFSYILSALASLHVRTPRGAFLLAASIVWGVLFGIPVLQHVLPSQLLTALHPTILGMSLLQIGGGPSASIGGFVALYGATMAGLIGIMVYRYRFQTI